MADNSVKLFGFEIKRAGSKDKEEKLKSIVTAKDDDGAGYVTASGAGHFGQYVDIDGSGSKDNYQLVMKYRGVAMHPECDAAIEDIVNESIVIDDDSPGVSIELDEIEASENIKKQISEEFENILRMLNFSEDGHDIFRRWYVDGKIYHHLVVDPTNEKMGIQDIRFIDAPKMRKVKEVKKKKDPGTNAEVIENVKEYYVYQESPGKGGAGSVHTAQNRQAVKFTEDSISYVTSGLLDEKRSKVLSHLQKAIKPVNQLRMMEDSLVIYRLARAPERRIFYIDVGNLPKGKAEEYMKNIMAKYRNKLVYDANTGDLRDDRKHMSMLEDFWLPRREGNRSTEISSLPGGDNLGQIDDIIYFQKRLYKALNVPLQRLDQENNGFSIGRSTEISRDEVKFQKFIDRLRNRFSHLFLKILKKQLVLKKIITEADWSKWERDIRVDYNRDNHFAELKESEILKERIQTLDMVSQYVGEYFTKDWVMKNVLKLSEEDIKELEDKVEDDQEDLINQQSMAAQQEIENQAAQPSTPPEPEAQPSTPPAQGQNITITHKSAK
tara:strand:- start:11365 stop:13020 length:1656 start_codon:yes stop_codon:yes gene_type:complete